MSNCSTQTNNSCDSRVNQQPAFQPRVDIVEIEGDLVLVADVPGADESHTEVSLEKNILTIKGTVPAIDVDGLSLVHREFRSGHFERAFTLTREIDRNGIEATVKDGVLRVRLPKNPDAGQKKITVTTA